MKEVVARAATRQGGTAARGSEADGDRLTHEVGVAKGMGGPFEKMAKDIAVRMRSKVHQQSFGNSVRRAQERRLSPAGRLAVERVAELVALQQRHQRTFDPALRTEAVQILRALPLLSTDEDPRFVQAQRALRVAAYFDAVDLPATYALINQHTKNAFLLDAVAVSAFFLILSKLRHPQTAEIVAILLPRLREVAPDLIPREAIHVLRLLHRCGVGDASLVKILTDTVVKTVADTPLTDVRQCAVMLAEAYPEEAKQVLAAAETRLCSEVEVCEDAAAAKGIILDVCRVIALTCSGPRGLLNSVARRSMDLAPQLTPLDIGYILKAFHMCSYRHLRLLRVLSSSQASHLTEPAGTLRDPTPSAVSMTLQALAHFYVVGCEEVVLTLVNAVLSSLEGLNFALAMVACVRLQCVSPGVGQATELLCGAPLQRYLQNAHSVAVTSRLLYALAQAGRCVTADDVSSLQVLLRALLRIRSPIPDDSRSFLLEAVATLAADSRCVDDTLKELVAKARERLLCDHRGASAPS
ncbi:putative mitochondrial RNA binding protein [Trypanosoma conorhini]|uniref:Putative mitochondrial RNA binding protein n=1 Tax=Trypanosoma conorhini TaxID=83891 RepID=A0A3R7LLN8_9TRYP|nr:putative mitochondrial RNA binding protein [Trypanosoma conorhini]RNF27133.1 putative mitochondrial RNA binding protein [Trypanosoma conorhini]